MIEAITLQTNTRQDIFDITDCLMSGIGKEFLLNAKKPVRIAVDGSVMSGKKIIPDASVKYFFGQATKFSGQKDYDEYWSGMFSERSLEVRFLNAAWRRGSFSEDSLNSILWKKGRIENLTGDLAKEFLKIRRNVGGIDFVHNAGGSIENELDICIKLAPYFNEKERESFVAQWRKETEDPVCWYRNIRIGAGNSDLFFSEKFQRKLQVLQNNQNYRTLEVVNSI